MGALSHKTALPPLVSFRLSPYQHFVKSLEVTIGTLPTEQPIAGDADLKFAAATVVSSRSKLRHLRNEALEAVKQLQHRWRPVATPFEEG